MNHVNTCLCNAAVKYNSIFSIFRKRMQIPLKGPEVSSKKVVVQLQCSSKVKEARCFSIWFCVGMGKGIQNRKRAWLHRLQSRGSTQGKKALISFSGCLVVNLCLEGRKERREGGKKYLTTSKLPFFNSQNWAWAHYLICPVSSHYLQGSWSFQEMSRSLFRTWFEPASNVVYVHLGAGLPAVF